MAGHGQALIMALKDLLVHIDPTPAALLRLRMAADLARRHGSRLTALYVHEPGDAQRRERREAEFGLVPAADIDRAEQHMLEAGAEAARHLERELAAVCGEFGLEGELLSVAGSPASIVAQHARFADLCIVRHDTGSAGASASYSFSEAILFGSGRPLLIVPDEARVRTLGRHLLIAWNSSRASARAANDALCLVERAERTTVLTINPTEYVTRYRALPPERIVEHLRRHSAAVEEVRVEQVADASIAAVIQEQARRRGADVIVAGAFGHPKVWEKLMGGVTCDLLAQMPLPMLMSH